MPSLRESCYGVTPQLQGDSPTDFSCVFKAHRDVEMLGLDVVTAKIKNDKGVETLLYLPETAAAYMPGRTSVEVMWRLLHENEGNRLLHTPTQFGNIWVRNRRFEYRRDMGGFSSVNASLPSTEQIADSLSELSPDLASRQKNALYRTIDSLFELVLKSNREKRQVDPEVEFERISVS